MKLTKSALAVVLLFSLSSIAYPCGTERWTVKVAQDIHVNFFFVDHDKSTRKLKRARTTTIADLYKWDWPFGKRVKVPAEYEDKRSWSEAEYQIWTVTAFLTYKANETDKDYHLVLTDKRYTMVAEIPHPDCIRSTPEPLRGLIKKARKDFDDWWQSRKRGELNQKVRVTGLGFFDTRCTDQGHCHAKGSAPTGIELHPVIAIQFLD